MHCSSVARSRSLAPATLAVAALLVMLAASPAATADILGLYVGGAFGQGSVEVGNLTNPSVPAVPSVAEFKENHSAYKFMAGVRIVSVIGAEIDYLDFGHPNTTYAPTPAMIGAVNTTADVRLSGSAAFALLYLPIPVVDVYAKAGVARLKENATVTAQYTGPIFCVATAPTCQFSQQYSTTNTSWAAGVGAQVKLGAWGLRAEYERFNVAGGNPGLATIGVTWNFL